MIPVFASRVGNSVVGDQQRHDSLIKSMVIQRGFNWSNALSCIGTHLEDRDKGIANGSVPVIHNQLTTRKQWAIARNEMIKETIINQKLLCFVMHPNTHIAG